MTDFDFSCIPCAGQLCFPRPVAERKACTRERHGCPYRPDNPEWLCRCCDDCKGRCHEHAELKAGFLIPATEETHAR